MENNTQEKESIIIGSDVGKKVNCSVCHKEGTTDEFVTVQANNGGNVYLCSECRTKVNQVFEDETKDPNIVLGALLGAVGAVIGGVIWYFVAIGTGKEIGYISLGLGYLVGMGVYFGSGKKKGHQLQIISAVLTLITIFITEKYIFDYFLNDYIQTNINDFPDMVGQSIAVPFFNGEFLKTLLTPIGLLIYAIGIYFAYKVCKPHRI